MIGTVIEIDGDYAVVRYDTTGTESHVALAIIGDVDIGDKVMFENFSYEKLQRNTLKDLFSEGVCLSGSPFFQIQRPRKIEIFRGL